MNGAKPGCIDASMRTAQLQKLNPIDHVMQLARSALLTQHALRGAEPIHKAA